MGSVGLLAARALAVSVSSRKRDSGVLAFEARAEPPSARIAAFATFRAPCILSDFISEIVRFTSRFKGIAEV